MSLRYSRRWPLLAIVALLVAMITACGGNSAGSNGQVSINFVSYTYGQQNPGGQGLAKLIQEFEATNPAIKVRPKSVPVGDVLTILQNDAAGGDLPDVAQIGYSTATQAFSMLPLRSFKDVAPGSELGTHLAGYVPSVLKGLPGTKNGQTLILPFLIGTPVLYYNADLFRAAGLDPANPPKTMSDVKQAALAIKSKGTADGVYFGAVDPAKSDNLTQSLVAGAGGALVTPQGEVMVDSPAVVEALSTMQDLTKSGAQPAVDFTSAQSAFSAGKLGMIVFTSGGFPTLAEAAKGKFDFRVAPLPGFAGRPATPDLAGSGLAILTQDQARARAAWSFIKFLTSDSSYQTIAASMGYLPLRPAAASSADPRLRPIVDELTNLAPYTPFPGKQSNQAVTILVDEAVSPIMFRGADPVTTLRAVDKKIKSILAN